MRKRQNVADPCCPTCGRKFASPKTPKAAPVAALATMTDLELYAYYKRAAPLEDVRFSIAHAKMSTPLMERFLALENTLITTKIPRADVYRQLTALQGAWRREDYWRTVGAPAARLERRRVKAEGRQAA